MTVYPLGIVLKELNESRVWLKMVKLRGRLPIEKSDPVFKECDELCRIIAVSRRTAARKPAYGGLSRGVDETRTRDLLRDRNGIFRGKTHIGPFPPPKSTRNQTNGHFLH